MIFQVGATKLQPQKREVVPPPSFLLPLALGQFTSLPALAASADHCPSLQLCLVQRTHKNYKCLKEKRKEQQLIQLCVVDVLLNMEYILYVYFSETLKYTPHCHNATAYNTFCVTQ